MSDIFIARQPIFKQDMSIKAYELLFRQSEESISANVVDGNSATSQVMMSSFVDIGLENLVAHHIAFINLTEHFLSNPNLVVIPPDRVVLEVLEDVEPTEKVIESLKILKQRGFTIALDDFVYADKFKPLLEFADIIKIDVTLQTQSEIKASLSNFALPDVELLAEKIETFEEFEFYKSLGFSYFQGYFFAKPTIVHGKALAANKLSILQLVAKVNQPDIEIEELSDIISTDVSLSHKVLKFINSPANGLRTTVDSIQQAVALLGLATIKNWVTVLALASNTDKPLELSTTALIRAKICQSLAKMNKLPSPDGYFTVGLFSTIDAMMDQPLDNLLEELPLSEEAKLGLLAHEGSFGDALNCVFAMEQSDFSSIDFMGLNLTEMSDLYLEAIKWADDMLRNIH